MIYKVKMLFRTVDFHSILFMIKNDKASKILIETETIFLKSISQPIKSTNVFLMSQNEAKMLRNSWIKK